MTELLEELESGVLTLTINRPPVNTITPSVSVALQEILLRNEDNPDVRCIVLRGAGNVFSAGADVGDLGNDPWVTETGTGPNAEDAAAAKVKSFRDWMEPFRKLHETRKPTLAIMSGAAAGAGLALALACDLRFCLDTAKLTIGFSKVGLSSDSGVSYFLTQLVGPAKAKELLFAADIIAGKEAYELGLVTKIASKDTFEQAARAYAEHIATLPTVALGYIKQNVNASISGTLPNLLDMEAANIVQAMETEDHKNAVAAFIKKEPAKFKGQ